MSSSLLRYLLLLAGIITCNPGFSQQVPIKELPAGWHLLDKEKDGYYGISLEKAYEFLRSKSMKSTPVIVAILDSGIDTLHEDLKEVLWHNPHEIPANKKGDNKNGYTDDVLGWNFLGNKDGRN